MRYGKIQSQIWFDEKFIKLTPLQQRLFMYLLTCPHGNLLGLFVLKKGYITEDLKYSKDLRKDLDKVIEKGLIEYDFDTQIVWLKNYLKHNPITNPNQEKAAIKIISELPKSAIVTQFVSTCEFLSEGLREGLKERLSKPESESESHSHSETDSPSGSVSAKQLSEKAKIMKAQIEKVFNEQFWPQYPRKVAKREAFRAFEKLFPLKYTPEDCNRVLKNIGVYLANLKAEKRPIDKTPYPATFLNREDFSVEPEPIDTGEYEFVEVENG